MNELTIQNRRYNVGLCCHFMPHGILRVKAFVGVVAFGMMVLFSTDAVSGEKVPNIDPKMMLFSHEDQIAGVRIGWYIDNALEAYRDAIESNRHLVLVASQPWCKYCNELIAKTLTCPDFNSFAGQAVFAISNENRDAAAKAIFKKLKIDVLPTITIIAPNNQVIEETVRLKGFFRESEMIKNMTELVHLKIPKFRLDKSIFTDVPLVKSHYKSQCSG